MKLGLDRFRHRTRKGLDRRRFLFGQRVSGFLDALADLRAGFGAGRDPSPRERARGLRRGGWVRDSRPRRGSW